MPSLNQISDGLIAEAMFQLKLAMGNVKDQKNVLQAQANIKQTWEDLLDEAKIEDRDAVLETHDAKRKPIKGGLWDPTSPVATVCLYIYQIENFCYKELNRSSRFKDETKVATLGPWAAAMAEIIGFA